MTWRTRKWKLEEAALAERPTPADRRLAFIVTPVHRRFVDVFLDGIRTGGIDLEKETIQSLNSLVDLMRVDPPQVYLVVGSRRKQRRLT